MSTSWGGGGGHKGSHLGASGNSGVVRFFFLETSKVVFPLGHIDLSWGWSKVIVKSHIFVGQLTFKIEGERPVATLGWYGGSYSPRRTIARKNGGNRACFLEKWREAGVRFRPQARARMKGPSTRYVQLTRQEHRVKGYR